MRERFEKAWAVTLPTTKGLDNHQMVEAIHERQAQGDYTCSARR